MGVSLVFLPNSFCCSNEGEPVPDQLPSYSLNVLHPDIYLPDQAPQQVNHLLLLTARLAEAGVEGDLAGNA